MSSRRQRVEDLGSIYVLLDHILEEDLFDNVQHGAKRWPDWFWARTEAEQRDVIHSIGYGIQRVKDELEKCLEIARGENDIDEKKSEYEP
jgi:hypothetical protein